MKAKFILSAAVLAILVFFSTGCTSSPSADKPESIITENTPITSVGDPKPSDVPLQISEAQETPSARETSESPEANAEAAETVENKPEEPLLKIQGLVNILDIDNTIIVDLKYATDDNFTGQVIYDFETCLLREETALKLKAANEELSKSGYRIKIFDGYRPPYAQKVLWKAVPNPTYVANPYKGGSIHSRGAAVDITIVDSDGNELEMPTEYDDLSPAAAPSSKTMSDTARKNMLILQKAMTNNGFRIIKSEWWHFNDTDNSNYTIVEVDPKKFNDSQQ